MWAGVDSLRPVSMCEDHEQGTSVRVHRDKGTLLQSSSLVGQESWDPRDQDSGGKARSKLATAGRKECG